MKRKPKISIEEQLYRAGIWERPGNPLKDAIADGIAGLWRSLAMLARPGTVFDPQEIACLKKMNKLNRQKYILRALKQREEAK